MRWMRDHGLIADYWQYWELPVDVIEDCHLLMEAEEQLAQKQARDLAFAQTRGALMASTAELGIVVKATDQASKEFAKIKGNAGGLGRALGEVSKIAGGFVLAQGLLQAPKILGDLVSSAGKLELQMKKASTVFGDQLGVVDEWAKKTANAMGLTKREAVTAAAGFADLLIPMGFTREQAAKMSTDVVGLSGALAEWSGGTKSAAEVSDILAKAMLGERDGLKALGISISEEDVKQRLLKNGTDELTGAALEQAKAMATQQLIFEKSTDAQAAFAEGSGSLARRQAELSAKVAQLKENIMVALIPVLLQVADYVQTKIIPALRKFSDENLPKLRAAVDDVSAFIKVHWTEISAVFNFVFDFVTAKVQGLVTVIKSIVEIVTSTVNLVKAIFRGDWATAWQEMKDIAGAIVDGMIGYVKLQFGNLPGLLLEGVAALADAGAQLGKAFVNGIIDAINGFFNGFEGRELIPSINLGPLGNTPGFSIPSIPDIPRLARGGPVAAGQPYIVGEQGPELFVPRASGSIVSNGAAGGVSITVNMTGATIYGIDDLERQVEALMTRAFLRGGFRQIVTGIA